MRKMYRANWDHLTRKNQTRLIKARNVLAGVEFSPELLRESAYVLEGYGIEIRYFSALVEERKLYRVGDVLEIALDLREILQVRDIGEKGAMKVIQSLVRYALGNKTVGTFPTPEEILIRSAEVRTGLNLEGTPHGFRGWDDRTYEIRATGKVRDAVEVTLDARPSGGRVSSRAKDD